MSGPFNHILFPIGDPKSAAIVLDVAVGLAVRDQARITLLRVIEPALDRGPVVTPFGLIPPVQRGQYEAAMKLASKMAAMVPEGVVTHELVRRGQVVREIEKRAVLGEHDLIVVGLGHYFKRLLGLSHAKRIARSTGVVVIGAARDGSCRTFGRGLVRDAAAQARARARYAR